MARDNGSGWAKRRLRLQTVGAALPRLRVLEGFAGEGELYRTVWEGAAAGAAIDMDPDKAALAATERRRWAVYCGDTEKALASGWMGHVAFDVVDLDAYGSPWPFLRAWCASERERAPETTLFLTDGYMSRASLAPPCRALFPGMGKARMQVPAAEYRATVSARLREWAPAGYNLEVVRSVANRKMHLHVLRCYRGGE